MGEECNSAQYVKQLFGKVSNLQQFIDKYQPRFDMLTPREVEVLTLIGMGLKTGAIARKLELSQATIQNHRSSIRKKLAIESQADYIKYSLAFGLIPF
ncbi:LuxR C-terminal-related transcriptional regulator [Aliifodinibius sp. S!AR15-10]|uniref:response regulator transcription factor n=1 Tax=Aliifodinibius sp. S!AR15-10 TaxID=2950437 RepID=UPI00285487B6|nr:LuxR C-terminal-related transcriptional regulator [Aliifodinibius sp. S!AR15-10]MDR8390919.1 LuxR C-terminal-related transcriptional regulator [Aliifodinibius sp. S!AR15-10]